MKFSFSFISLFFFINAAFADDCLVRRAAFDIGSASSRIKIADVDTCKQVIVKFLYEAQEDVGYKEDLSKNKGQFSSEIQKLGRKIFDQFKSKSDEFKVPPKNRVGVATAAFREAKNADAYLKTIAKETGLKITIVSQDEEAQIGFYSALTEISKPAEPIIVWDIGGGSMQITTRQNQKFLVYEGALASVTFKEAVLKTVQHTKSETPNPMSVSDQKESLQFAEKHAQKTVGQEIQSKIKEAQGKVFGVGSVQSISIKNQTGGKESYSLEDVLKALQSQGKKTDEQIGGKYASTDVTNLALVGGYMKALGIKEVRPVKVNNANGLLVNPRYWQ